MIAVKYLSKIFLIVTSSLFAVLNMSSCNSDSNGVASVNQREKDTVYVDRFITDTVIVHDTIKEPNEWYEVSHILQPDMYDSVQTRKKLEEFLWSKRIDRFKSNNKVELETRTDLEYLPYFLSFCNDSYTDLPAGMSAMIFISLCSASIDDKNLFDLGKFVIDNLNNRLDSKKRTIEYPDSFTKGGMETFRQFMWFEPTAIDTLRVKVIAHNDREALEKLEKYYHDKGDDKGLAIYYKVMLGYEGNGDLAERFYRVLEPHFKDTPEFRGAVREVLLRAAICDGNARAQELCDSLGFSLCDYRLPLPEKIFPKK